VSVLLFLIGFWFGGASVMLSCLQLSPDPHVRQLATSGHFVSTVCWPYCIWRALRESAK